VREWLDPAPVLISAEGGHIFILEPEEFAGYELLTGCEAPACPNRMVDRDVTCGLPAGHDGKCWPVSGVLFVEVGVICPAPDLSGCL
jgi:hypothetical protein